MTRDEHEHERERRAFWDACCAEGIVYHRDDGPLKSVEAEADFCAKLADAKLAERDKRWPAPEETIKFGVDPETEEAP